MDATIVLMQARIDRQKFSTEGLVHDRPAQTPAVVGGAVSNVGKLEGSDVLQAATEDLLKIFQMKVGCLCDSGLVLWSLAIAGCTAVKGKDSADRSPC